MNVKGHHNVCRNPLQRHGVIHIDMHTARRESRMLPATADIGCLGHYFDFECSQSVFAVE